MYEGPKVKLTFAEFGRDGNAFAIMGVVTRSMKDQLDLPMEEIDELIKVYREEAMSGDYSHLLVVSTDRVDFIDDENDPCDLCGHDSEECDCDDRCHECWELLDYCACDDCPDCGRNYDRCVCKGD